jgi:hypothetical protein
MRRSAVPLDKADAFAFVKVLYEAGVLEALLTSPPSTAGGGRTDDKSRSAQEPGTRFLDSTITAMSRIDLDEIAEFVEAAGPLIKFLADEPEMFRRLLSTAIVQRKLGRQPEAVAVAS